MNSIPKTEHDLQCSPFASYFVSWVTDQHSSVPYMTWKDPWISLRKMWCLTLHEEGARESAGCWFGGRVAWRVPIVVGSAGWRSINLGNKSPFSFACCLDQSISRSMTLQEAGTKGKISTTSILDPTKPWKHCPFPNTENQKKAEYVCVNGKPGVIFSSYGQEYWELGLVVNILYNTHRVVLGA